MELVEVGTAPAQTCGQRRVASRGTSDTLQGVVVGSRRRPTLQQPRFSVQTAVQRQEASGSGCPI